MESGLHHNGSDLLLEHDTQRWGMSLHERLEGRSGGIFQEAYWQGLLLDWAMRDPALRADLFRLVDALPALPESGEIARHAREYLLADGRDLPMGLGLALRSTENGLAGWASAFIIRRHIGHMARRFIAGRDARQAGAKLKQLWNHGFGFTVDLLGETAVSDAESQAYFQRYADLIDFLPAETAKWAGRDILDRGPRGGVPRANLSLKLSAMDHLLDPIDPEGAVERLVRRVTPLLRQAKKQGAFINIDLEQWSIHDISFRFLEKIALEPEFASWPDLGIVVQVYLKSAPDDIDRLMALARKRNAPLTVRLVKGAYWDYEVVHAKLHGYTCPVFAHKAETDVAYERLSRHLLENRHILGVALGTHNLRSISSALAAADNLGARPGDFELQMLYGMAEDERDVLRDLGHRVRLYTPLGDLITGMAYLVRRLLENTSNSSFLRLRHHDKAGIAELLQPPGPIPFPNPRTPTKSISTPFENCPLADFTVPGTSAAFARAVAEVEKEMPWQVSAVIAGKAASEGPALFHICPNEKTRIATSLQSATTEEIEHAVATAREAWPAWRDLPLQTRAARIDDLGRRLAQDRLHLAAMEVHEQAKPWREADADIAEAIDFCHYYAREALTELAPRQQGGMAGENNLLIHEGRGLTAVIAPWNFPLAILCGMTTAALVAGNAVLLKPAEQANAVALAFHRHALAAGIPPGVLAFLPGDGEIVGAALVRHRDIAQIAFTGSRHVGTAILKQASELAPGQTTIKRVVCEMGGKNAIIVDDDADLDEAITGVLTSAFGYAGQKCSACSRVIVVGWIFDHFVTRLKLAAQSLIAQSAAQPSCLLPPVIDEASQSRLLSVIDEPGLGARLLFRGETSEAGWFVPPTIFEVTNPHHRLMQQELFGPVLAVFGARDFSQALEVANTGEFALTGAVYSRSPRHLERARAEFRVGNLYLNRPCTGAQVDRQPFGGFKMSGAGTKAGGPGYLANFTEMRVCTENTMRRGFAPEILS